MIDRCVWGGLAALALIHPVVAQEDRTPVSEGPRGRVVIEETGEPVAGLTVRISFGGKTLSETITDEDGRFWLPRPERSRRVAQIVTDDWSVSPRKYRLDEHQASGKVELLFRAKRIFAAPLEGRLLEKTTRQPVPHFLLIVNGPMSPLPGGKDDTDQEASFLVGPIRYEAVITDEDGRFVTKSRFEEGMLEVTLLDYLDAIESREGAPMSDEPPVQTIAHRFEDDKTPQVELLVEVGPTYRLELSLPDGREVGDFHAAFVARFQLGPEMHRLSQLVSVYQSFSTDPFEVRAPLRPGRPTWARFTALAWFTGLEDETTWTLEVRSNDGLWFGTADVTSVSGEYAETLPIALRPTGAIRGVVRTSDGKPVPAAWMSLVTPPDATPIASIGAGRRGKFAFDWIEPGLHELRVETQKHEPWRQEIRVVGSSTVEVEAILTQPPGSGPISGVLRSMTGQRKFEGELLRLRNLDDPEMAFVKAPSSRKERGGYIASFRFEGIPPGRYALTLKPRDNLHWDELRKEVTPPTEGIEFVCHDETPTSNFALVAVDATSKTRIDQAWSMVWLGDPMADRRLSASSEEYADVPAAGRLTWTLRAAGYQVAVGDESVFQELEGDNKMAEIPLRRGWGQVFKVTTPEEAGPVEGVEIFVDGVLRGVTDRRGIAIVNLDQSPASVRLKLAGWKVTWCPGDEDTLSSEWGPHTPVYMSEVE